MGGLSVVEILKVGLSGFVFLLAYLGYRLYRKEQERDKPREIILTSVNRFMWISVVLAVLVGGFDLVNLVTGSASTTELHDLRGDLGTKEEEIARLHQQIEKLREDSSELRANEMTLKHKVDLGLYYAQPVGKDKVEKRDSKKAREYLVFALKYHDQDLSEPRKAEIVKGLVRIREKIVQESDFEFLIEKIEEYRYSIEKQLDLAKVYWAFANLTNRDIVKRRGKSLEHFLKAACEYEQDISDNDRQDIRTLIAVLIKSNDRYLREHGPLILESIAGNNKPVIKRYLDEWLSYRDA